MEVLNLCLEEVVEYSDNCKLFSYEYMGRTYFFKLFLKGYGFGDMYTIGVQSWFNEGERKNNLLTIDESDLTKNKYYIHKSYHNIRSIKDLSEYVNLNNPICFSCTITKLNHIGFFDDRYNIKCS